MVRKVAVTLEEETVRRLDRWVREGRFSSRSRALQNAADFMLAHDRRARLSRELAKLDPEEEQQLAEENLGDVPWPEY